MRVLILSVTAGQGHNICAKATMAALEEHGVECRMLDTLSYVNSLVGSGVDKGYLWLGKFSPYTFGKMYEAALSSSIKRKATHASDVAGIPMAKKVAQYIEAYAPDCIVSTHIFASLILTYLREKRLLDIPVIGINTDFAIHPFWEEVDQNYIVLACDKMNYAAYARGLSADKILPFGIPVHSNFKNALSQQEARKALGLPERMTLTMMSGSMGFGHLPEQIRTLDALPLDFQIVVICGSNADVYAQIEQERQEGRYEHDVFPRGFVNNVHEYMGAGDILVSKPGGLSTSECLSIGRPLVLIEPIPGIETFNASFLVNCGAAVHANEYYTLPEAVYNLLTTPARVDSMMQAQRALNPGGAADRLAEFIIENYRGG